MHQLKGMYTRLSDRPDPLRLLPKPTFKSDPPSERLKIIRRFNPTFRTYRRSLFYGAYGQKPAIIKFCEQYSKEAHQTLSNVHAPELYYFDELYGGVKIVVMEFVIAPTAHERYFDSVVPRHVQEKVKEAVLLLHQRGIVWGDLRRPNVLVTDAEEIKLVDFDWAGMENQQRYPPRMNNEIEWPDRVRPNAIMKKEDDLEMLARF